MAVEEKAVVWAAFLLGDQEFPFRQLLQLFLAQSLALAQAGDFTFCFPLYRVHMYIINRLK